METPSEDTNARGDIAFLSLHPFVRATVLDKIRGTMVGSALGDCIGLYTEFLSKSLARDAYPEGRFQLVDPATGFREDGHRNKFAGTAWTDDTDHALLILLSYLHRDGNEVSSQDLAERLRIWIHQGLRCLDRLPLGLGQTVGSVVLDKDYLTSPAQTAFRAWVKSKRVIAPNGALMRTHPLGIICLSYTLEDTFRIAAGFSSITHADPRCVVSCCISTALIRAMLRGEILGESGVDTILEKAYDWVNEWVKDGRGGAEYVESTSGEFKDGDLLDRHEFDRHTKANTLEELQLDEARKIGYVYKCLGSAIWALRTAIRQTPYDTPADANASPLAPGTVFENIITEITFEAGDADTNACAAGALAGCWLGYNSLPAHWRDGMMHVGWMVSKCDSLGHILGVISRNPGYKGSEDPDTRLDGGKGLLNEKQLEERERALVEHLLLKEVGRVEQEKKRLELERKSAKSWTKIFSGSKG